MSDGFRRREARQEISSTPRGTLSLSVCSGRSRPLSTASPRGRHRCRPSPLISRLIASSWIRAASALPLAAWRLYRLPAARYQSHEFRTRCTSGSLIVSMMVRSRSGLGSIHLQLDRQQRPTAMSRTTRGSLFQTIPIGCMRVFMTPSCSSEDQIQPLGSRVESGILPDQRCTRILDCGLPALFPTDPHEFVEQPDANANTASATAEDFAVSSGFMPSKSSGSPVDCAAPAGDRAATRRRSNT